MSQHFFTFTLHQSGRKRKQVKQQRELSEILHILDADDRWVTFTMQPVDMQHDFPGRECGRALRSRLESELPGLIYAYEYFSNVLNDDRAGLAKAKLWWLENVEALKKHYAFVTELGGTFDEQQRYILEQVGLISREATPTVTLPSDLDIN